MIRDTQTTHNASHNGSFDTIAHIDTPIRCPPPSRRTNTSARVGVQRHVEFALRGRVERQQADQQAVAQPVGGDLHDVGRIEALLFDLVALVEPADARANIRTSPSVMIGWRDVVPSASDAATLSDSDSPISTRSTISGMRQCSTGCDSNVTSSRRRDEQLIGAVADLERRRVLLGLLCRVARRQSQHEARRRGALGGRELEPHRGAVLDRDGRRLRVRAHDVEAAALLAARGSFAVSSE